MNEQDIFLIALERPGLEERDQFLQSVCVSTKQKTRIEYLLKLHDDSADFLQEPAVGVNFLHGMFSEPVCELPGHNIGPYKLLEQIGEGGMGVVYMAAQQSPVRRKVALKIIKPGMDTRQVVARFEAERQALAMMDHPNIARVLDAGATESGRPFFAMELVRGIPLTDYCHKEKLPLTARLELFVDVCRAVQHAHLKGIIHRDIKPSNVMVTLHDTAPVVKMIDFGVAKAMNQQLTEKTLFTNYNQMIGTPLYMSPEQAEMSGLDVDTRSDIYSLGVLLYELLTETTPFEKERLREAGYDEMRRIIQEVEPPRASTRIFSHLNTLTQSGQQIPEPQRMHMLDVGHALKRDLDWVVARAMEKNRSRRYQSAQELADDVLRYMSGRAIAARPPSMVYRLQKLVRKHRTMAAFASAFVGLLVIATIVSSLFAWRALQAEQIAENALRQAETDAAISQETQQFLVRDLLGQASPTEMNDRDLTVRELLHRAAERIDNRAEADPLVAAAIHQTIGNTYHHLGDFEASKKHLKAAHAIHVAQSGEAHRDSVACQRDLTINETYRLGGSKVVDGWQDLILKLTTVYGDSATEVYAAKGWLAYCLADAGEFAEADELIATVTEVLTRELGPQHPETLECLDSQAEIYSLQKRYDEAESTARHVMRARQVVLGERHPKTMESISVLAKILKYRGEHEESLEYRKKVLDLRRRTAGELNPTTISETTDTALALEMTRQPLAAQTLYEEALANGIVLYGPEDFRNLRLMTRLATLQSKNSEHAAAIKLLRAVLDIRQRTKGTDHEFTLDAMRRLAGACTFAGQHSEAMVLLEQLVASSIRLYGQNDVRTSDAIVQQMHGLQEAAEYSRAIQLGEQQLQRSTEFFGREHPATIAVMMQLGYTTKKARDFIRAEELFRKVLEIYSRQSRQNSAEAFVAANQLAAVLRYQKRYDEALPISQKTLAGRIDVLGEVNIEVHESLREVALCLQRMGRLEESTATIQRAIDVRRKLGNDQHISIGFDLSTLKQIAKTLTETGNHSAAAKSWTALWRIQSEILSKSHPATVDALIQAQFAAEQAEDWGNGLILANAALALARDKPTQSLNLSSCLFRNAVCLDKLDRTNEMIPVLEEYLALPEISGKESLTDEGRIELARASVLLGKAYLQNSNLLRAGTFVPESKVPEAKSMLE